MTVETATFISTLNSLLPPSNDPKSEGDDHLRLIKTVLKASFPNVAGAVTLTHSQLNDVAFKTAGGTQTFTQPIQLSAPASAISMQLFLKAGTYNPHIRSNATLPGIEFINGANSAQMFYVFDSGVAVFKNSVQFPGELQLYGGGYMGRLRGDTSGLVGFINNAGNAWNMQILDNGNANVRFNFTASTFTTYAGSTYGADGNVFGTAWGGWLSNYISTQVNNLQSGINGANANANGRAPSGGRVQWDSGITETANLGVGTVGDSAPYVVVGGRSCGGSSTANCMYLHLAVLRNY